MDAHDDPEARIRTFDQPPNGQPGGQISVAGVGDNKTIECNDSLVSVSGVSNTVGQG
jgi:hypothetical protein